MQEHGALIIDCDKVGHEVYKVGKPCYFRLIEAFGERIIAENKEIDRKILGGIVFANPVRDIYLQKKNIVTIIIIIILKAELEKLNGIVWPAMADDIKVIIGNAKEDIVVVEAAILLKAGWEKLCHEVSF